jgi:hypothetical protein
MIHLAFAIASMALSAVPQTAPLQPPVPKCKEGVIALKAMPLPVPPPTFVRRAGAPRLMVFIHGLQGDGTTSWTSHNGVYWPSLVAQDDRFRDFDVFVYEYVVRTKAPVRLSDVAEQFFSVAFKSDLVSKYRDAVFVTEGDGVFVVRELLRRVPPLARRISMIYVAGRVEEASNPLTVDAVTLLEENRPLPWREFREYDAASWELVESRPWIHCAVLSDVKLRLTTRDDGSSFCSTMPIAIAGTGWQALRPSCHGDLAHAELLRSIGQRAVPATQMAAPPTIPAVVSSKPFHVACNQVIDNFIEFPIDIDPATEELLSLEASVVDVELLKAQKAFVDRVYGKTAIVRFTLVGSDPVVGFPGVQAACPVGRASIRLQLLKRRKN